MNSDNAFQQSGSSPQFEPLLDDVHVGTLLGLHSKTVQKLARKGELPAVRIGRYWRFRASSLNEWLELKSTSQAVRVGSAKGARR